MLTSFSRKGEAMAKVLSDFIGRQNELKQFEATLDGFTTGSPHIVFIHDAAMESEDKGGIGKTKLVNEFLRIAQLPKYQKTFIVIDKIFDFYEPVNRDQMSRLSRLVRFIEEKTGTKAFDRFWKNVRDYYLKAASIEKVMEDYFAGYNQVCAETGKKVIRFFDTFELAEKTLNYLKESYRFIENQILENSFLVLSGRNQPDLSAPIWTGFADKMIRFPLSGFSNKEANAYFKQAGIPELNEQQISELNHKARGRPILLALMVDYLQNILRVDDLLKLDEKNFKADLVAFIKEFRNPPIDQAILAMAHLKHWCNKNFLQHFIDPEHNFDKNYQLLRSLSFVRTLGGAQEEYIVLHDQMQKMVSEYILDKDYAEGEFRREISEWAIGFYEKEIENYRQREAEYLQNNEMAKWQVARDERFILKAELWYHKLYVGRTQNINDFFFELFDPSLERGYLDYCYILLNHLDDLGLLLKLPHLIENRIKLRLARLDSEKFLFTNNQYYRDEAGELFEKLITAAREKAENKFLGVLLCDYGALKFYSRDLSEAEKILGDSITVLQKEFQPDNHDIYYFLGKSQNWLGYIIYQQGRFTEAVKILEEAAKNLSTADHLVKDDPALKEDFKILRREQIDSWIAQVRGNLCRIYREVGNTQQAIYYGESSIKRRERLGNPREIIKGLNSLGLVYSRGGEVGKARSLYEKAERLLQNVHDPILKGRILTNQATLLFKRDKLSDLLTKNTKGKLTEAKKYLETSPEDLRRARTILNSVINSLEKTNSRELSTAYHNLGELCLLEGNNEEAINWFNNAVKVANVENDSYTSLNSRQRLVLTAYLKDDQMRFNKFKQEFEAEMKKLRGFEETARYVMRFYITVGDFYYDKLFEENAGVTFEQNFKTAFNSYTESIVYTKNNAPNSMNFAQEIFAERIFELLKSKTVSPSLREELLQKWQAHGLHTNDLLRYFDF